MPQVRRDQLERAQGVHGVRASQSPVGGGLKTPHRSQRALATARWSRARGGQDQNDPWDSSNDTAQRQASVPTETYRMEETLAFCRGGWAM